MAACAEPPAAGLGRSVVHGIIDSVGALKEYPRALGPSWILNVSCTNSPKISGG